MIHRTTREELTMPKILVALAFIMLPITHSEALAQQNETMVRISEIRIDPNYLAEYTAILKEEADASVRLEPAVLSIFPMYEKEHPTEIRILDYAVQRDVFEICELSHCESPAA